MRQDRLDQIRRGVAHVLAVVEHQQPDPAFQRSGHALAHGLARLLGDAQHRRDGIGYRRRISDRGEFEKPNAVVEVVGQPRPDLERKPCFADPANTGERDQLVRLECLIQFGEFGLPSDEGSCSAAEDFPVSDPPSSTAETRCPAFGLDLEHIDRFGDIA